jgi:hypothetical protein
MRDLIRAFDSSRCQLEHPRQHERRQESDSDDDNDETDRPVWDFEERKNLSGDLNEEPGHDGVGGRDLINISSLQFGEKIHQRDLRTGTGVMAQGEIPKQAGTEEGEAGRGD